MTTCRICGGTARQFADFGQQPISDAFIARDPSESDDRDRYAFRLAVACCESCHMVQLVEEVARDLMFHADYPYVSSGSELMRRHFDQTARRLLAEELTGADPFVVEIGSNDGAMLATVAEAGVRHLGVEPCAGVAAVSRGRGVRAVVEFFDEDLASRVLDQDGPADVIFSANTFCHIPYVDSVLRGVERLLSPKGVFVFEDPYLGDIVERNSFDQIYDEHFYLFSAQSVSSMAERFGLELVDVERLPVHGGEVRYTLARRGARRPSERVSDLLRHEIETRLSEPATLDAFAARVGRIREDLRSLLERLNAEGKVVAGYGATAKSATVTNYCGLGPGQIRSIYDNTPAKQGRLTPGSGIPVRPAEDFPSPYPDYAVLFAWNHGDEIRAKESDFTASGGRWITYVPEVRVA